MANKRSGKPWLTILYLAYGALMVYLLFFRDRTAADGMPYWEQVQQNYNLTFGRTIRSFWSILTRREYYMEKWGAQLYYVQAQTAVVNLVGNVLMFIPYGIFLPARRIRMQRMWKALPAGFLTVLTVEILQLFTLRGKCDVDDVLLNVSGIAIGYILWRFVRICRRK